MVVKFSAPGKVYIFGEHAVVYGGLALACAIDVRTYVIAEKSDNTTIYSDLGKTGLNFDVYPYISLAIKKIGIMEVSIYVTSQIPIGSGLGSSSAVTVATLAAINQEFGLGYKKDDIARMGYEVEQEIQGYASPTDTYLSTFGGMFMMPARNRIDMLDCDIVIGNTNISKNTKEIINQVRIFKEEFPDVINPIIKTIGSISEKGEIFAKKKDYISVGRLMNVNQGLLDAIGINNQELSSLVYAARNAGAFGAKITGAGRGGCMVAITDSACAGNVAMAIEKVGGKSLKTRASTDGLILEWRK